MSADQQRPAPAVGAGQDRTDATRPEGPARSSAWEVRVGDVAEAWSEDAGAGAAWVSGNDDAAWAADDADDDVWAADDADDAWAADGDAARSARRSPAARGADRDPAAQSGDRDPAARRADRVPVVQDPDPDPAARLADRGHARGASSDDPAGDREAPVAAGPGATDPVGALREALAARGFDAGAARPAPRPAGSARRPAGRGRRAPADEPPEDGPAAVGAEPDHESVARAILLRQLTAAPRSRQQLAEALARRDVPEDVADRVLDRFTEVGLVDDAAYAEVLVRSRHAERGLSRRALALELRRRGVDDGVAQEALAQVDDDDEEHAARALARKKLASTRGLDRETRMRRVYGALGRRGYGGSLVARVVREELDAEEPVGG
jgi:regulatory protein